MNNWKRVSAWLWMLVVIVSIGATGLLSGILHSYPLAIAAVILTIHCSANVINHNVKDKLIKVMGETSRLQEEIVVANLDNNRHLEDIIRLLESKDHIHQQILDEYEKLHGPLPKSFEVKQTHIQ